MAVSERGYVGVTRTGNGRLTVAAAIDVRRSASPGETIESILRACGMPVPAALERAEWTGTPPLTRRSRHVAAERLFVVGDSAGYVEPFTGEGMSFAMGSAARLAPLAAQAVDFWHDSLAASWERQLKREVFAKQWTCRCLKRLLRSPALCGMAITACRKWPTIPRRIMARLNG
jgi:flavin-dependent dehydrogenase